VHILKKNYLLDSGSSMSVNLGTEYGASVFEIIKAAEQASGKVVNYTVAPRIARNPPILIANTALAKEKLGWSATRGVKKIMADAWQWHKKEFHLS